MSDESNSGAFQGACLCGQIRYEVDEIGPRLGHCHCRMCRKFHGAAFATLGEAKAGHFRWLAGEEHIKSYQAPNGTIRQFCESCGSSLIFKPANDSGDLVEFSLGTLDSSVDVRPDAHIFTDFAANWYHISDDLPCFAEGRDSRQKK